LILDFIKLGALPDKRDKCRKALEKTEKQGKLEQTTQSTQDTSKEKKGRGWRHILDKVDYSGGPSDNVYVYG